MCNSIEDASRFLKDAGFSVDWTEEPGGPDVRFCLSKDGEAFDVWWDSREGVTPKAFERWLGEGWPIGRDPELWSPLFQEVAS
jgi:hypothetical protein